MDESTKASRKEFEQWFKTKFSHAEEHLSEGKYGSDCVQTAWLSWQGSRQALEIALPVLEQQESKDVFIVVRKPGHLPYIKRPVGDIADYLMQIYQHNPSVSCDVVTYRFPGALGQWVQDGKELLAELEVPHPTTDTYRQIENDDWIEWGGGKCPVPDNTKVQVKFWDGYAPVVDEPQGLRWSMIEEMSDIIAYRVIENDGREE